jgi:hypothetical protein
MSKLTRRKRLVSRKKIINIVASPNAVSVERELIYFLYFILYNLADYLLFSFPDFRSAGLHMAPPRRGWPERRGYESVEDAAGRLGGRPRRGGRAGIKSA